MLSINASWRLPSTGPNMFAIRPFGVSTDCTNIVKEIQVTKGENICIVHIHACTYICMSAYTWNFKQWTLLWPLYIMRWFRVGRAIGRTVPSMKPQHCGSAAPLACMAAEKAAWSSHTRSNDCSRCLYRSWMSSMIYGLKSMAYNLIASFCTAFMVLK